MKNNDLNAASPRWQTELYCEDLMLSSPTESTDKRLDSNSDSTDRSTSSACSRCSAPHQIRHQLSNEKSHRDDVWLSMAKRNGFIRCNVCNKTFPKLVGVATLRYHLKFMCKPTPNRCAAPFESTMRMSPQFKSHRSRGSLKIWDSTDVHKSFAEERDGSHRCNLCGRRFTSKTGWSTLRYHLHAVCRANDLVS